MVNASDADGTRRHARTGRVWGRYGLPGLVLVSPTLIGVRLASVIALAAGSPKRSVEAWMTVSLAVRTVGLTLGSSYGIGFVVGLG